MQPQVTTCLKGAKPLSLSHHLAMFGGHRSNVRDLKKLICQMTSQNHVTGGSCNFMNSTPYCMSPTSQV